MNEMLRFRILTCCLLGTVAPLFASDDATPVRTAKVRSGVASWGKAFVGSVEPARRSVVGTAVAGRIAESFVEPGDAVEANEKLSQLRLVAIQISLASAKADLDVATQRLAESVAGPRKEELRRLEARAKGAKALVVNAQKRFERLSSLSERGASARRELDEATSAKESAEQNLIAAQAELEQAQAGTRKEQLAQSRAMRAKAEEMLNQIQDQLDEHTIRAPFAGYLVKRLAEKGEWVAVGQPVAEIVELNPVEVRVAVPEEHVGTLAENQEVRGIVDAISGKDGKRRELVGRVFRIIPDADSRSRSFPVRIRIDNTESNGQPLLKPGMLARVFLPVGKKEKVLLLPQDALVLDRNRTFVFAVDRSVQPPVVTRIEVETGPTKDALIQVKPRGRHSLSEGSEVVIEGNERLATGQAVSPL